MEERQYDLIFICRPDTPEPEIDKIIATVEHAATEKGGKVESTEEFLLVIKTTRNREGQVKSAIRELHSYQLPECIAIAIDGGSEEYLRWLEDSVV